MGNLVSSSGTGFSAHSLYLDVLTSSGIVSLVILILMFYFLFKKSIKNRNHLNITLTLYLMIAALTGIPVINISFWTIIAFIYTSTKTFLKQEKIEKEGFTIENKKSNI